MAFDLAENFDAENMDLVAFTWRFRNSESYRLINADFNLIGFLLIACLGYMIIHTGSFFLSLISLLNIFMSIPVALVIYRYIFQVTYFSSLHLFVVIIIVGIGADDIFVFHDFWKNTFTYKALRDKPILRLSLTFRRATNSMAVTTLTSMVAFSACTTSEVMPLRAFGWFAAIVVPLVFL